MACSMHPFFPPYCPCAAFPGMAYCPWRIAARGASPCKEPLCCAAHAVNDMACHKKASLIMLSNLVASSPGTRRHTA